MDLRMDLRVQWFTVTVIFPSVCRDSHKMHGTGDLSVGIRNKGVHIHTDRGLTDSLDCRNVAESTDIRIHRSEFGDWY